MQAEFKPRLASVRAFDHGKPLLAGGRGPLVRDTQGIGALCRMMLFRGDGPALGVISPTVGAQPGAIGRRQCDAGEKMRHA